MAHGSGPSGPSDPTLGLLRPIHQRVPVRPAAILSSGDARRSRPPQSRARRVGSLPFLVEALRTRRPFRAAVPTPDRGYPHKPEENRNFGERRHCYVDRRTKEGLSKREIIRCLKRYVARDVYGCLEGLDRL